MIIEVILAFMLKGEEWWSCGRRRN